jgi:Uncharacterized protein conserved in archaea
MDLEGLRQTQADERRSEKLQELPDTFYEDTAEHIKDLREERDACEDYSKEARRLDDALGSARQVTEAIYERRVGKVVRMASLAANGHPASEDRMTNEEREMFDTIVSEIRANQSLIHETLEGALKGNGETGTGETATGGRQNKEPETDGYTTVRITESLPEFVGTDGREYSLGQEDVARIPEENARALCEKEAAIELEQRQG